MGAQRMGALANAITSASTASSFILGMLIARWTREELKPGKPYFTLAQHALPAIILCLVMWNLNKAAAVCSALALFTTLLLTKYSHPTITGFPLGIAMLAKNTIPAIFCYGLVSGTMAVIRKRPAQAILEAVLFGSIALLATSLRV